MSTSGFDRAVDAAFDPWRGPGAATTAAVVLSNVSDYGFAWLVLSVLKGRRPGPARRRSRRALAIAGLVSMASNALLKKGVDRDRPGTAEPAGGPAGGRSGGAPRVRRPTTSSFPSGHTLASFCTATTLATGPVEAACYLGFATAVAASRVHLRAHHASDVVGGAVIGVVLGCACRRAVGTGWPGSGGIARSGGRLRGHGLI
ncbi:MAG: phosphatase PAP2 family protein [Acidimicrobiales bacterium]